MTICLCCHNNQRDIYVKTYKILIIVEVNYLPFRKAAVLTSIIFFDNVKT